MSLNFEKFTNEGNRFLKDLAVELGHPNEIDRAGRILTAVLHAIRDLMPVVESVQIISQLPMFLKAVYVENWKLSGQDARTKSVGQFIEKVKAHDPLNADIDFQDNDEVENAAAIVFIVIRQYISTGEMEDIKSVLPKELKHIVEGSVSL